DKARRSFSISSTCSISSLRTRAFGSRIEEIHEQELMPMAPSRKTPVVRSVTLTHMIFQFTSLEGARACVDVAAVAESTRQRPRACVVITNPDPDQRISQRR